jgi:voltage-gated potassium channel
MQSRLLKSLLMLAAVFAVGTVGYVVIEGAPPWDAFYMTAITLTTVGYREVFPLSPAG